VKKEMNLVLASIVQIGHVQNSPKVNGNGAKLKQLADKAEADRRTLCKFLDEKALFNGLLHMYPAIYKEMRDSLQPSSMDRKVLHKQNKSNAERETETLKMSAPPRNRRGHLQLTKTHGRRQRITSLCHLGIYLWKMRRRVAKETSPKHLKQIKVTYMSDYRRGLDWVIVFIEHLLVVTTSNYSVVANSHNLQFTTARTKSSQSAVCSPVVW
jgi:hypothetical protein